MQRADKFWEQYADRVLQHRGVALFLCLALTLVCGLGLGELKFSTDYRSYFSPDNPDFAALEKLEQNFGRSETVLMALTPPGGVFTREGVAAIRWLSAQWGRVPYARGSVSITSYYDARGENGEISAEPLIPEGELSDEDLARIRTRALNEPRLVHGIVSPQGDVAGVAYFFELPHADQAAESAVVASAVREIVSEAQAAYPGLQVHLTGVILLNETMRTTLRHDISVLNALSYALMFVLLGLFFLSPAAPGGTLIVALMGSATALGIAGWMGITLTAASVSASIIILTLSIADCVHLLSTASTLCSRGVAPAEAARASLRENGHAIFMTTLTTASGALGMLTADSPPYRHLGLLVAIGVTAAWIFSATLIPLWICKFPPRRAPLNGHDLRGTAWMADVVVRFRNPLLIGALLLTLGAAAAVPLNKFGDNYVEFFEPEVPFRKDTEYVNQHLTGVQYVEYGVYADGPDGVYDPAYLGHLDAFVVWLRSQAEVVKVNSVVDLIKRLNETMHDGDPAHYRLPASRDLAAQYLLFYEMSLPSGQDLTHLVNLEKSAVRISVQLTEMTSSQLQDFDERARGWMEQHWPAEMRTRGSGIAVLMANIAWRNFASMASGTVISALLIVGLLYISFGSLRLCLVSLLPNFLPALLAFGAWGLTITQVSMSLAVVLSLTVGIVVDDTIHFLSHYGKARRGGETPEQAVRHAFASVGTALWLISAVLVGGFLLLTLSDFRLTAHLGLMTSLIIGIAVVLDFFLLAPLLLWLERKAR